MSDDRARSVEEIFAAAIEVDVALRADFVRRAAHGDPGLIAEVESLLAHHDESGSFLAQPALATELGQASVLPTDVAVRRIGAYEVLGVLGEGGMGVVYMARQESPRRIVALKVMSAGSASPRALKRFAHESEMLGRLHHPGIAQIHEAGVDEAGRPYFAMEYVRGSTIAEYAARKDLGARDRLALVAEVCDAVQHAHEQGIVHRDLKPSNILVEETPAGARVKVLDFGVARATESDVRTLTMLTDVGQIVGTVPYMSPEQASGDAPDVDARSDVYSLGVVVYELLSGRLPHDLRGKRLHEAVRILREEDPTPLSGVVPVLRGDVETIVAKALEKEPRRRYLRAADLAGDIRRYLADQPIAARPASRTYQLVKFARRHRVLVASVAIVIVVLAAGIVGTTSQMVRAERERDRVSEAKALAEQRFEEAEALRKQESESRRQTENALRRAEAVARLQRDMFASAAPGKQGRNVKVADVLDGASREIAQTLAGDPDLEMAMRASLGDTYRGLGLLEESERELVRVVEIARTLHGDDHVETLRARVRLADVVEDKSRFDEARKLYDEALAGFVARGGADDPDALTVLQNRASLRNKQGEGDEAEADLRRVLAVRQGTTGADTIETAAAMSNLGQLLHERGKPAEAEDLIRRALDVSRTVLGDRAPDTLTRMSILATYLRQRGALEDSEKLYREILATRRDVQGERHYDTFTAMNNLAGLLQERGQVAEAEKLFRETLEIRLQVLGEEHRDTLITMNNLALLLTNQKKLDEAETLHRRALAIKRRVLPERDSSTTTSMANLALVQYLRGDIEGALASYRDVLAAFEATSGARHVRTGQARENVGGCLAALKRWDEAERELLAAHDILEDVQGPKGVRTRAVAQRLVDLYTSWGKTEEAASWRMQIER